MPEPHILNDGGRTEHDGKESLAQHLRRIEQLALNCEINEPYVPSRGMQFRSVAFANEKGIMTGTIVVQRIEEDDSRTCQVSVLTDERDDFGRIQVSFSTEHEALQQKSPERLSPSFPKNPIFFISINRHVDPQTFPQVLELLKANPPVLSVSGFKTSFYIGPDNSLGKIVFLPTPIVDETPPTSIYDRGRAVERPILGGDLEVISRIVSVISNRLPVRKNSP